MLSNNCGSSGIYHSGRLASRDHCAV